MKRTVLGLLLLLPSVALAQSKRLAVVELDTPPNMMGLGAQLTKGVVETAQAQGYAVTAPDTIATQLGDEKMKQLQACNGRPECVRQRIQGVAADRVVVGALNRDEKHYLVKLWLIDLATGELIADVDRSILIASRRLQQDVAEAVPGLLRGEKEARGKLSLTANTKGVSIEIDGLPAGRTPLVVELKPGKHQIKADKKAYYPIDRYVTVTANATTEEELRLVKIPGEVAEDEALPDLPQQTASKLNQAKPGVPNESMALGAGALVLAAAGTGFLLASEEAKTAGGASYQATRQSRDDQRFATALFAGAGVMALTAVILGLSLDGDEKLQAAPAAGPGGGGFVVTGSF